MAKHKLRRITGAGKIYPRGEHDLRTTFHVDGEDRTYIISLAAARVMLAALKLALANDPWRNVAILGMREKS